MGRLLEEMAFRGRWRDYQARLLDELALHLEDGHLHVVAAPGSGKTVLGLEVLRRLGKPALVVSPTLTIRNQWIDRLFELFHSGSPDDPRISKDVYRPAELTVVTYQALLAALTGEEHDPDDALDDSTVDRATKPRGDASDVVETLRRAGIATFVLDEAHHLRNEWWKHMQRLKDELSPFVVALTATPPYDVGAEQWKRYAALCGPIDAEISIPELVVKGDLCPHQDFVHFSLPTAVEQGELDTLKNELLALVDAWTGEPLAQELLESFPWVRRPVAETEAILKDPRFFTSLLVFRQFGGREPSVEAREALGGVTDELPSMNAFWLEVLLQGILFDYRDLCDGKFEPWLDEWTKRLRKLGIVERKRVSIREVQRIRKALSASAGKFRSLEAIVAAESASLGDALRLVVLSDYIRADEGTARLGVVPIFRFLLASQLLSQRLGVLTGSLVIVPERAVAALRALGATRVQTSPVPYAPGYVVVEPQGEDRHRLTAWVTRLFRDGEIRGLVGTQALLGEGWDSPALNTLVLASAVGSFMLSNQMRGRAIRRDPDAADKVANVWHLATVDVESLAEKLRARFHADPDLDEDDPRSTDPFARLSLLGEDLHLLRRRFRAFEGLCHGPEPVVENGIRRMRLDVARWDGEAVTALNHRMLDAASNRREVAERWRVALRGRGEPPHLRQKLSTATVPPFVALPFTLKHLFLEAGFLSLAVGSEFLDEPRFWTIGLAAGALAALPRAWKAVNLLVRTGSPEARLGEMGKAVLEALHHAGEIKTPLATLRPEAIRRGKEFLVALDGGTFHEKTLFLEAMAELLAPLENPRFLLIRHSKLGKWERVDYHAVPEALGRDARAVRFFVARWERHVGPASWVNTRTADGRRTLLRARARSFSALFVRPSERLSVWE